MHHHPWDFVTQAICVLRNVPALAPCVRSPSKTPAPWLAHDGCVVLVSLTGFIQTVNISSRDCELRRCSFCVTVFHRSNIEAGFGSTINRYSPEPKYRLSAVNSSQIFPICFNNDDSTVGDRIQSTWSSRSAAIYGRLSTVHRGLSVSVG